MKLSDSKTHFQNLSDSRYADNIINSLPGIFYLYEKVADQYFLKRWNDNHVSKLKFSNKELLNMQPYQFFSEKEYKKVDRAIKQIFTKGSTQVKAVITTKNNLHMPHLFEGYKFEEGDRLYFMGVGIDISFQHKLEHDLDRLEIQNEKHRIEKQMAAEMLSAKKRELISIALQTSATRDLIEHIKNQLNRIIEKQADTEVGKELADIHKSLLQGRTQQDQWEIFKLQFIEVHEDFFDRLQEKHPGITNSELKFCSYLHIHMSSSQIASALNVTNEAIRKSRYRIRKKFGLTPKESLEDYISLF